VHKKINQAYVMLGLPLFKRPDTAYYPISLFNLILGGDGFTSRLGTSVRSDAGLTYSIYSSAESNYVYPATFYISFFTGHATVNKAIAITLREVQKILRDSVTAKEIADGKKVLIDGLPSMFRSKEDIVETYAWNEYYGRPDSIFMEYPARINALTRREVTAAAAKYLKPDAFTYIIVGDTSELFKAEKAEGFCVKELPQITIITPETLYNQSFLCPKKKR
jgi:zinc protease